MRIGSDIFLHVRNGLRIARLLADGVPRSFFPLPTIIECRCIILLKHLLTLVYCGCDVCMSSANACWKPDAFVDLRRAFRHPLPPTHHRMPRIPDLPGFIVPSSSDQAQWLRKAVSELCRINNKSGPLVILSGFGLTCLSAPASLQRVHPLHSRFLALDRCALRE